MKGIITAFKSSAVPRQYVPKGRRMNNGLSSSVREREVKGPYIHRHLARLVYAVPLPVRVCILGATQQHKVSSLCVRPAQCSLWLKFVCCVHIQQASLDRNRGEGGIALHVRALTSRDLINFIATLALTASVHIVTSSPGQSFLYAVMPLLYIVQSILIRNHQKVILKTFVP